MKSDGTPPKLTSYILSYFFMVGNTKFEKNLRIFHFLIFFTGKNDTKKPISTSWTFDDMKSCFGIPYSNAVISAVILFDLAGTKLTERLALVVSDLKEEESAALNVLSVLIDQYTVKH